MKVECLALPLGMVMVQLFTVVTMVLSKLALNIGMHPLVLLVYRNLIGAAVVAPLAVVFEWEMRKKVNLRVMGWISINGTFGVLLAMGLYYWGLRITSAAYAVNFLNLIPVATFIIAVALRVEMLVLSNWAGRMKLLGAVVGVAGTMVVTICKGKLLVHPSPSHHFLQPSSHSSSAAASSPLHQNHSSVAGTLFLCGSCLSYALWFIIQARVAKLFPSRYWATAFTCASGSLQSALVAAVAAAMGFTSDQGMSWRLGWDLQLATVAYSGVFNTGATFLLVSWAVARRGPIYPPMFNSLSLVVTAVVDSVLLGTDVYLGGVLGTVLVVVGLYAFLWGKGKELAAVASAKPDDDDIA
ncbi:hypothetical protein BRADI_1g61280v3 [Brachypodium distachyon]|uniref:WAT1-related protein n=2 Tax=Brachypodium distachyon TaxID=15368 RepID=A0A2K2DST4_BRADI|nr:hypothetical protein BRADI_1g61280v3 [Brachypodium distachyon]